MSSAPITIGSGLRDAARRAPEKVALRCGDAGLRYDALAKRIDAVATAAAATGLGRGDHVTLVAPNCLEYVEIVAGLSEAGLAVVTASPHLTAPELATVLEDSGVVA